MSICNKIIYILKQFCPLNFVVAFMKIKAAFHVGKFLHVHCSFNLNNLSCECKEADPCNCFCKVFIEPIEVCGGIICSNGNNKAKFNAIHADFPVKEKLRINAPKLWAGQYCCH